MIPDKQNTTGNDASIGPAETGNASNPTPHNIDLEPANNSQLLDGRAEKYIREVASPEDYPDAEDWQDADRVIDDNQQRTNDKQSGK